MSAQSGEPAGLTSRERDILDLIVAGLSNREVADTLHISKETVRYHVKEIHSKLETGGDRDRLRKTVERIGLLALNLFGLAALYDVALLTELY